MIALIFSMLAFADEIKPKVDLREGEVVISKEAFGRFCTALGLPSDPTEKREGEKV